MMIIKVVDVIRFINGDELEMIWKMANKLRSQIVRRVPLFHQPGRFRVLEFIFRYVRTIYSVQYHFYSIIRQIGYLH